MSAVATAKPSLTLERRLKAPPEKVYAAWTNPQTLSRWMGGPEILSASASCDVRVGGRYDVKMIAADDEHNVGGVYREVVPNRKLVFTWAWRSMPERESLVTVEFVPDGEGTLMLFKHEQFFDEGARDRHNKGWTGSFEKLAVQLGE